MKKATGDQLQPLDLSFSLDYITFICLIISEKTLHISSVMQASCLVLVFNKKESVTVF